MCLRPGLCPGPCGRGSAPDPAGGALAVFEGAAKRQERGEEGKGGRKEREGRGGKGEG